MIIVVEKRNWSPKYVPRTVLVDLDPSPIEQVISSDMGNLFDRDDMFMGLSSTNALWPIGHYIEGDSVVTPMMDKVRKEIESCDWFHAFQLNFSTCGGTGSGVGALILGKLREEYPDRIVENYAVFPSQKTGCDPLSIYNTVSISMNLIENSDLTRVIDNEGAYESCFKNYKTKNPTIDDFNNVFSDMMIETSSTIRYSHKNICDFRKLAVLMKPFPRMSFLMTSSVIQFDNNDINAFVKDLHNTKHLLLSIPASKGRCLSTNYIVRGRDPSTKFNREVAAYTSENNYEYADFARPDINTTNPSQSSQKKGQVTGTMTSVSSNMGNYLECKFILQFWF